MILANYHTVDSTKNSVILKWSGKGDSALKKHKRLQQIAETLFYRPVCVSICMLCFHENQKYMIKGEWIFLKKLNNR